MTITTEEWMKALQEAMTPRPGGSLGKTTRELSEIAGINEDTLKNMLRRFMAEGRLVSKKEKRQGIDGAWRLVPTYSIKAEK